MKKREIKTLNAQSPPLKVKYYYDGSLLLAEKDESGKIQKVYINDGEGILSMVRYVYNSSGNFSHHQRLYYLYDSLGSVSLVTGENGMPLQEYYYTPYGSTSNVERDAVNNLRFIGRYGGYKDDDTDLTYFWHRWYDEEDGRWKSRDLIRDKKIRKFKGCNKSPVIILGKNLLNLYYYANNRPILKIDKSGLSCESELKECTNHAIAICILHELELWTAYALCLSGCEAFCLGLGPLYSVCFTECASLCTVAREAMEPISRAICLDEQVKCRFEYENCKKDKERDKCK